MALDKPPTNQRATRSIGNLIVVCAVGIFVCTLGCSRFRKPTESSYVTIGKVPVAQAEQAKKLNSDALHAARKGNWEKAERLLHEALESDVNYAPAHNNLGQIYLRRHQLYLAAWEFEFAINLMPDRVEPYINLGLVYETANQLEKAAEAYESALQRAPDDRNAISCSARVAVKQDSDPSRAAWLLEQVVMHDNRAEWLQWAKELLATRYGRVVTSPMSEPYPSTSALPDNGMNYLSPPSELVEPTMLPIDNSLPTPRKETGNPGSAPASNSGSAPADLPAPLPANGGLHEATSLKLSTFGLPTVPNTISGSNVMPLPTSSFGSVQTASAEVVK